MRYVPTRSSSDWIGFVAERGIPTAIFLFSALFTYAAECWGSFVSITRVNEPLEKALEPLTALTILIALAVVGTFDAVLQLPASAFLDDARGICSPATGDRFDYTFTRAPNRRRSRHHDGSGNSGIVHGRLALRFLSYCPRAGDDLLVASPIAVDHIGSLSRRRRRKDRVEYMQASLRPPIGRTNTGSTRRASGFSSCVFGRGRRCEEFIKAVKNSIDRIAVFDVVPLVWQDQSRNWRSLCVLRD
jgi:hypothetical protein